MKILVAGDSITEGITGISYLKRLQEMMPDDELINLGLGGDTIIGIGNRLLEHLKLNPHYDIVILEAGHNDILVPTFEEQDIRFKLTAFSLKTRGSIPIKDPEIFKQTYTSTLKAIQKICDAKLFVTTLSCINEDLSALTNIKRKLYNQKIRRLVSEFNQSTSSPVTIIEIAEIFDHFLGEHVQSSYLLDDYFSAFFKDAHNHISVDGAAELSDERSLNLTIDGVHLNAKGADLYSHIFYQTINDSRL